MLMERETFPILLAPALVRDFVTSFERFTEAPDEFLACVPIFVGSVLAGRWFEFNGQFLNNYYLIVGPTGTTKKTTAQSLSIKLLRAVKANNPSLQYEHIEKDDESPPAGATSAYPIATHFSVEGLQTHAVGDGTSTAVQMGEYGTLFEVGKRQSQQNTISELTNMYDGNLISVKTVSRNVHAENYAISILGASTESWLGEFCSGKNISGGFVNRHVIVTGTPSRILPKPTQPSDKEWADITGRFSDLLPSGICSVVEEGRIKWQGAKRIMSWDSESEYVWNAYYKKRVQEMRKLSTHLLSELSARELTHATKLAGISAFLDQRQIVSLRDLVFGTQFARWSIQNAIILMTSKDNPRSEAAVRVINKLKKSGPMNKTDLARALGGRQKEINTEISHMSLDGILEECPDGLLRLTGNASNSQQDEIDKYFGKSNISEFSEKKELEVDQILPIEPPPHPFSFIDAPCSNEPPRRSLYDCQPPTGQL